MTRSDRYRGCLLGLALGDAVGTTCDGAEPGAFRPIDDMLGGGPHRLKPGQWTGETSVALCLADSLVRTRVFDARDQMERYSGWIYDGYMSCLDNSYDVDPVIAEAVIAFRQSGNPWQGDARPEAHTAVCLARIAPVAMFYASDPDVALDAIADSVRVTHGAPQAVDACRYFAGILLGALRGVEKSDLLGDRYCRLAEYWYDHRLHPEVAEVANGSFLVRQPPEIIAEDYVVSILEAALWAFATTKDFREGALAAANLGLAASTVGAVYGQLAGAFYGPTGLPNQWRDHIARIDLFEEMAYRLHELSDTP